MSRLLVLALGSLLVPALAARAESTESKRVVAVLYFDNNTGDPSLNVLQKGFADMMVTDLSAVEQLQLVEREKLQQIIEEQKLQQSKYFDAKTAVRLGQLVGARYAVTGSFQAVDPQLRIDIKLLDIRTGAVVVADKVTGLKNKLFELQQHLVNKFIAGLQLTLEAAPRLKSRAPDMATLLSYSKGIDLADQGKLQEASQQLAAVVSKAPTFLLARERHEQILARLKAAETRRTEVLSDVGEALGQRAEQFLQAAPKQARLDEAGSAMLLGYRLVRMEYLARKLRAHLAKKSPHVIMPGHERQALALLQLWRAQALAYVQESGEHFRRFQQRLSDGTPYLSNTHLKLQPEDEERLQLAKYRQLRFEDDAALKVAESILQGWFRDESTSFQMGPTLADLDPSAMKDGLRLMEQALQAAEAQPPRNLEHAVRRVLELHGDVLMLRGQVEEAVAKWQQFLDRFPTSDSFTLVSNKIKTALGMGPNSRASSAAQYGQPVASCDKRIILEGYSPELNRRMITQGYKAVPAQFAELEAKCGQAQPLRPYLRSLIVTTFLTAANANDCPSFHALAARFLELGGSKSDLAGYLKNYVPHCRPEGEAAP
ncbi:MAG: hypothetical protein JXB05_08995 [Myxococcaceae bacterium]|nr:hypothetical protein [Myxococcaceae bacterium]